MSIIVAARKLCALLLLPSFLIGSSLLKAAEPQELSATQLLFEPRPIPAAGTPEPEFVPVASALAAKQTNEASATQQQLAEMTAAIAASDNETGAAADPKVEQLLQAGLLNARLQQHDAAIALLDRARTLSKITKGIDNTDQFPLMDALATSLAATARYEAADALQDEKLQLAEAAFGENSLEMAMALQQVGDWNLQAFLQRSNITLSIPRMNMQLLMINGLNAASSMQAAAGSMQNTTVFKLYLAKGNFLRSLGILNALKDYTNPALLETERKLLTTLFLSMHRENILYEPDFYLSRRTAATGTRLDTSTQDRMNSTDYDEGIVSYQRALSYIDANRGRTAEQIAGTLLEEADWDLLFTRSDKAREKYQGSYDYFDRTPVIMERAGSLVYPEVPVVLPVFLPAPNSREKLGIGADEPVSYFGYFDVSFGIGQNGSARRIKLLGQGGEVSDEMEVRLKEYLGKLTFRPRYKAGMLDEEPLQLRYYVAY